MLRPAGGVLFLPRAGAFLVAARGRYCLLLNGCGVVVVLPLPQQLLAPAAAAAAACTDDPPPPAAATAAGASARNPHHAESLSDTPGFCAAASCSSATSDGPRSLFRKSSSHNAASRRWRTGAKQKALSRMLL